MFKHGETHGTEIISLLTSGTPLQKTKQIMSVFLKDQGIWLLKYDNIWFKYTATACVWQTLSRLLLIHQVFVDFYYM